MNQEAGLRRNNDSSTLPSGFNCCAEGLGIHEFTFEACSDFTRVTARWVAQPPKATFVTRLRDGQLPNRPARQLPDQPTTLWVVPSSTGVPRLRGALSGIGYKRRFGPRRRYDRSTPETRPSSGCACFLGLEVRSTSDSRSGDPIESLPARLIVQGRSRRLS